MNNTDGQNVTQTAHQFSGIYPGDHIIHRLEISGRPVFAYGIVRKIDDEGRYHADYQASRVPAQPEEIGADDHVVVGRISADAYQLARMRGWPSTREGVDAIVRFSGGDRSVASLPERFRLAARRVFAF